jgi:hypothetical protein
LGRSRNGGKPSGKRMGQVADRHRKRPGITNADSIPDKGTDDAYGNPFLGLPRQKIKDNAIGANEADSEFLDTKHYVVLDGNRRLTPGVKYALGDALGVLDVAQLSGVIGNSHLPNLVGMQGDLPMDRTSGSLPMGRVSGKAHRGQIADFLSADRLIKPGTLPIEALTGRPWASKTDAGQVRRIARRIARDVVRDMVKATSLKGG